MVTVVKKARKWGLKEHSANIGYWVVSGMYIKMAKMH